MHPLPGARVRGARARRENVYISRGCYKPKVDNDLQWIVAVAAVIFRASEQHPATRDEQGLRVNG